jgi:uncharacterized protein (DUF697 family)
MERVEVKSAWLSKINWTQAVSVAASIGVIFGVDLDPKTQVEIVAGIQGLQSVATWAFRTFFNRSVSPASL